MLALSSSGVPIKKPGIVGDPGLFWLAVMLAGFYKQRLLVARTSCNRFHYAIETEATRLLARRKFAEALQPLADIGTSGREHIHVLELPSTIANGFMMGTLERVCT